MKSNAEREDDARIMKLFRGRCIGCMGVATQVHELVTRARTKKALTIPQNRVPLCQRCHNVAHWGGYTLEKETMLRRKAEQRLEAFGIDLNEW